MACAEAAGCAGGTTQAAQLGGHTAREGGQDPEFWFQAVHSFLISWGGLRDTEGDVKAGNAVGVR